MSDKKMKSIDLNKCEIERDYLGGMTFSNESIRQFKYSIKIKDNPFFEEVIYLEVITKKKGGYYGQWGEGKLHFCYEGSKNNYNSLIDALKSKYNLINDNPELLNK